jgi:hypothetical protein
LPYGLFSLASRTLQAWVGLLIFREILIFREKHPFSEHVRTVALCTPREIAYGTCHGERVHTLRAYQLSRYVLYAYNLAVLFKPLFRKELIMTSRDRLTEATTDLRNTPLSLLYSVLEDAKKYEGYLQNTEPIHDQELAEFLDQLRDTTRRAAKQAEALLAQRLADGGVQ